MLREIKDYIRYIRVYLDTLKRDEALSLVVKTLGSVNLAQIWIKAPLPLLGNVTPYQLISEGRSRELIKYLGTHRRYCREDQVH